MVDISAIYLTRKRKGGLGFRLGAFKEQGCAYTV
jgi:hypothetical protein